MRSDTIARRTVHRLRRRTALAAVTGLLAACAVTGAGLGQAAADAAGGHRAGPVTSGDARFEVLSPTLIRTEYAGDGSFVDGATFNAVGRGSFTAAPYTTSEDGGWLTITTSALTLRYKEGSGPFGARNLTVRLNAGATPVTATPWRGLTCASGALCEAEDLVRTGLSVAADHSGYTGSGFVAGFQSTGDALSADVDAASAGSQVFAVRYANAVGGDGQHTARTLTLAVDGGAPQTVDLPATADWDTWGTVTVPVTLGAGRHTVTLSRTSADSGNVNVDSVALVGEGAPYPPVSGKATVDCVYGVSCEAEDGRTSGSAVVASDHTGYAGSGFVAELNQQAGLARRVLDVPADGSYTLHLRYANGPGGDGLHQTRTATLTAGGTTQTVSLPATDDWNTWRTVSVPVTLKAGGNDIALGCPDATSCHVNADTLAVTAAGDPAPAPHLALGGYRRGLDGVDGDDGAPATTPGLLYRDGWYLLDDTSSALYDTATGKATARPGHGGTPYQDGYVFGYGHDYTTALGDLATLTGPPELLPQWAYGVWYSEYIDRTAADYENTILPAFRSAGVPLDVLVTDTDFKAPDTWNGWGMDPGKFPDPGAFFDWSESQGLHNTLNVHPSIRSTDPQFAAAEATAGNRLQKISGCPTSTDAGDCYAFDWGDPDQLKAYLDLHTPLDQQGNDFWWLDWCCDASRSSQPGVTPDAWINEQYAARTGGAGGRGFVLSRAFGSLQTGAGAVPTGPWADKRSTVHFTGDTASSWGTLRAEVGYTPGEAAATGMSAISHDIGGHNDTTGLTGSETYTSGGQTLRTHRLPDDMYARWVQFATFQPIDRLHSNHSDRLPWQYGDAAKESAEKFLNLREDLVPYTYTLAQQAEATGVPVVRPLYLAYPEEENAYTAADGEYLYGPDMLVAPVTTPGDTATTTVWFPPGQWTDYFTGETYTGGTTRQITSGLGTTPVFVRAGGIVPARSSHVTADAGHPLTAVTLDITEGASGAFTLYEDDGTTGGSGTRHSATTAVRYTEHGATHTVGIGAARGHFRGQADSRRWTLRFHAAEAPAEVTADGRRLSAGAVRFDAGSRTLTVELPRHDVRDAVSFTYR